MRSLNRTGLATFAHPLDLHLLVEDIVQLVLHRKINIIVQHKSISRGDGSTGKSVGSSVMGGWVEVGECPSTLIAR